jgi:glycosyltransferase involved in cell wall biosynthesis
MTQPEKQYDLALLIPCYNNLEGLMRSLNSIHYHIEKIFIIIVDDGSDIPISPERLRKDCNIKFLLHVIRLAENAGITKALNTGLRWINENVDCRYIARLDCGDLCKPERFYVQMDYLNDHPETGLLGSWCYFHDPKSGYTYRYTTPQKHEAIQKAMYFRNVFIHPTVIFKKEMINTKGFYPESYPHAEDYAYFWELLSSIRAHIISRFLLICESNSKGISSKNRALQLQSRMKIINTFGSNWILKFFGKLKMTILIKIPDQALLMLKRIKNKFTQRSE